MTCICRTCSDPCVPCPEPRESHEPDSITVEGEPDERGRQLYTLVWWDEVRRRIRGQVFFGVPPREEPRP